MMFHWVNQNLLPLAGMKQQMLKLISDLFNGKLIQGGEPVWDPSMKANKLSRVLVNGKAVVGAEATSPKPKKPAEEENEFDVDMSGLSA